MVRDTLTSLIELLVLSVCYLRLKTVLRLCLHACSTLLPRALTQLALLVIAVWCMTDLYLMRVGPCFCEKQAGHCPLALDNLPEEHFRESVRSVLQILNQPASENVGNLCHFHGFEFVRRLS